MCHEELEIIMDLYHLEYELKPVRVMVVRDLGRIRVDGVEIEVKKGTEIELPRWLARLLSSKGYVQLVESTMGLEDIARIHFSVYSAKNIIETPEIPKDFYWQAQDYIRDLDLRVKQELNPVLLEEKRKAVDFIVDIANRRLIQMLQVLRSTAAIVEISSKLTPEEKLLLDNLHQVIEKWVKLVTPGER